MIPAPYQLLVRRQATSDVRDKLGNPIVGLSDPQPFPCHGYAPGQAAETIAAGRQHDSVAWTLYCPAGVHVGARDVVVLHGQEWQVRGDSDDWTHGPWDNPAAGVVVELLRQEG